MALSSCTSCLMRPSSGLRLTPRITPIVTFTAPFSTTTPASAAPKGAAKPGKSYKKPLQMLGRHLRRGKVGQNAAKKKDIPHFKKPAPGERKAFRKRIQLSNNNAAPVKDQPVLDAGALLNPDNLCRMVSIPDNIIDPLRTIESFKITQPWGLFRKPHMLVRNETIDLMTRLKNAGEEKQTVRTVLTGDKISGKTMLLLQAQSYAFLNNWVVISIPEAQDLVNSNTEYSPVAGTTPLQFNQPVYCLNLLQSILKANRATLEKYKPSKNYSSIVPHFPKDATLADLIASAREAEFAWPVFKALWHELTAVPGGPSVLLTIDGLSHLMKVSAYRDPAYNLVHAHELTLVRLLIDALAGKTPMANGGAVVAATSRSNAPRSPSMLLALEQSEAAAKGLPIPVAEPYNKAYDARVYEAVRGVDVLRVSSLSKAEARAVMEYWAASGLLRATVDEATVTEKWALAGNGIIGELERASLMYTRSL